MVVAEEVQQPVQREHPQLGLVRMTGRLGLAPGDAGRDDDIAQPLIVVVVGKREDVGRLVLPRYLRLSARMRASLTSAMLTSPAARAGAVAASQRARPPSRTARPVPSLTETRRRLLSGSTVRLVGLDDLLHELMPHDVAIVEMDE